MARLGMQDAKVWVKCGLSQEVPPGAREGCFRGVVATTMYGICCRSRTELRAAEKTAMVQLWYLVLRYSTVRSKAPHPPVLLELWKVGVVDSLHPVLQSLANSPFDSLPSAARWCLSRV